MKKAYNFCEHHIFHNVISIAIIVCSLLLGIETFFERDNPFFIGTDIFFSIFFLLEIIIRIMAERTPLDYFKLVLFPKLKPFRVADITFRERGFWNWFDFLVVMLSLISLAEHFVEHPEFLVVCRLLRVFRIIRLLEVSDRLKAVEKRIVSILPTVFSFVLLLVLLIYIYSIVGIYLFGHGKFERADFSSLPGAFLTLFQLLTLDGWADMMNSTASHVYSPIFVKGYFVSFVILTAIVCFNVFVAVLTSQVHEKMMTDARNSDAALTSVIKENEAKLEDDIKELLLEVRALRKEVNLLKPHP